jgi:hypothetical protein
LLKKPATVVTIAVTAILVLGFVLQATFGAPDPTSSAINSWNPTTSLPSGVFEQGCAEAYGYVYCVGGWTTKGSSTASAEYAPLNPDGTLGQWQSATSYPMALAGMSCVASSGYLYCVDGYTSVGSGYVYYNNVYYAQIQPDGSLGAWQSATSYPQYAGSNLAEISCVASSGYIYCMGGGNTSDQSNGVYYAQIQSDGTLGSWQSTSSYPISTSDMSCATSSGYIYCVGGYFSNAAYYAPINSNGTLGSWQLTSTSYDSSSEVNALSCAALSGYVYCVGGLTTSATLSEVNWAQIQPDGSLGAWQPTTTYPTEVPYVSCLAYSNYVYCIGGEGSDQTGLTSVYSGQVLVVTTSTSTTTQTITSVSTSISTTTATSVVTSSTTATVTSSTTYTVTLPPVTTTQTQTTTATTTQTVTSTTTSAVLAPTSSSLTCYEGDSYGSHQDNGTQDHQTHCEDVVSAADQGFLQGTVSWSSTDNGGVFSNERCVPMGPPGPPPGRSAGASNQVRCEADYAPGSSNTQAISAAYSGDSYHAPSTGTFTFFVGKEASSMAVSVSVACDRTYVDLGNYTKCTANVATADGSVATGTVAWSSTDLGTFTQSRCDTYDQSNLLTCTTVYKTASAGEQKVTATYSGDSSHNPGTGTFVVFVQNPSASLATDAAIAVTGGALLGAGLLVATTAFGKKEQAKRLSGK